MIYINIYILKIMRQLYTTIILLIFCAYIYAGQPPLSGKVTDGKQPIPFATVQVKATNIGTASDKDGKFNMPEIPEGSQTLVIKALGYKTKEVTVTITPNKTLDLKINLDEDVLGIDQVVVTADKTAKRRVDASMIVNAMTPKQLEQVQAVTLSDGLNYTSGVRMETTCQNCGSSSVRLNGMDGSYSQVLINGRQIFSGLAGVYGLEMIPANMIQQLEVIKGGGSALYGSNAIAGTVNIITKEPLQNSFEASIKDGLIGLDHNPKNDLNININTSVVSEDKNTGLSLYATHRKRQGYDANGDDFTEMARLNNTTFGANFYHRIGYRNKITIDYFNINEDRRGGNNLNEIEHESDIAESIKHKINTAAINFTRFIGQNNGQLSVYGSFQDIIRNSYYGAKSYEDGSDVGIPDLTSYGYTTDFTYNYGIQLKNGNGKFNYIVGLEDVGDVLNDKKLGYTDSDDEYHEDTQVSDQLINTYGAFGQVEYTLSKFTFSGGLRLDYYDIDDRSEDNTGDDSNTIISPRLNILYKPVKHFQIRGSFSTGYRAPQVFDEDLHIETSGSRKVLHENSADLKQESSQSYMLSGDYQGEIGNGDFEVLVEGFYTGIKDPFSLEYSDADDQGTVTATRVNGDKATVQGINIEAHYFPSSKLQFDLGFTSQKSQYNTAQAYYLDEDDLSTYAYEKDFVRTPNNYGYLTVNADPLRDLTISLNGTYTGTMLVEYYGEEKELTNPILDSEDFFDLGLKAEYVVRNNKSFDMGLSVGVKNIFNSYQSDFDSGVNRDPGYIYGPSTPRSIYFGIRIGNIL